MAISIKHPTERQEQETLIQWIGLQHSWLLDYTMCIRNEVKCSAAIGKKLNAQGRLKGAADLWISWPTTKHYGLYIEMKTLVGKLTKEQKEFLARMNKAGYLALKANGANEAIRIVKDYLANSI